MSKRFGLFEGRAFQGRTGGIVGALAVLVLASAAAAGPIAPDPTYGTYVMAVNDGTRHTARPGAIGVDADGRLYLGAAVRLADAGQWTADISRVSGQADPALSFAIGASNLGVDLVSFNFSFAIPVALSGTIVGHSALTYGLSTSTDTTVSIAPTGANILTAFERDTDAGGLADLNKGLDIGAGASVSGPSGVTVGPFVGTSLFTGSLVYDLMVVNVGFTLTRGAQVTMAGFVEQTSPSQPVPEPSSLLLVACAACTGGLSAWRRRRPARARGSASAEHVR